jgi:hypothetical protein
MDYSLAGNNVLKDHRCPVLAFFARAGSDAADTTSWPFRTNRVAYAFVVPALRRQDYATDEALTCIGHASTIKSQQAAEELISPIECTSAAKSRY